jgi:arylsulfatase A-like enzyme
LKSFRWTSRVAPPLAFRRSMPLLMSLLTLGTLAFSSVACAPDELEDASPKPHNILVIVIDTFRADRLGRGLTPKMDAFASEATVFNRAVTTIATTMPAHASMFTGLAPNRHGVRWNGDELADSNLTAVEILRDAGYETAAFVGKTRLLTQAGFHQGFSILSDARGGRAPLNRSGEEITAMARDWICGEPRKPFFAWVHYNDVHSPYELNDFAKEQRGDYAGLLAEGATGKTLLANSQKIASSPEDMRMLNALYDGAVLGVDRQIGNLLDECPGDPILEDTIVILTSDHGQLLGEHRELLHGGKLWEQALRIPLIIRHPTARPGLTADERVGIADIAPTLIDLGGQNIPAGLQGRSIARAIFGEEIEERVYVSEVKREGADEEAALGPADLAVYDGHHKVIRKAGEVKIYDIASDAEEVRPIPTSQSQQLIQRSQVLMDAYSQVDTGAVSVKREDLDPSTIDELRALGYIE